jgi:hypothetical protein
MGLFNPGGMPMNSPRFSLVNLLIVALLGLASAAGAAPKSQLWDRWAAHDPDSTAIIDHDAWNQLLQRYVVGNPDGINRFAYQMLYDFPYDRKRLREYLDAMSKIEISRYNRDQQRAYWINLYNALTIDVVLTEFPVYSIRDITSGLFSAGPWGRSLVTVEDEELTLDDIEHRILRPVWQDPRIHYAVNCASLGCPNLQNQAFTAANTEDLLNKGAVEYVNHPRGAQVVDGELQVSSIYDWFEADFGGSEAGVIEHLKQYANDELRAALEGIDEIDNDHYDWKLNSVIAQQRRSGRDGGS